MTNILQAILDIFAAVAGWIVDTIPTVFELFYVAETGLTLLGVMAVASLAIGLGFLLIGVVTKFIKFK